MESFSQFAEVSAFEVYKAINSLDLSLVVFGIILVRHNLKVRIEGAGYFVESVDACGNVSLNYPGKCDYAIIAK